MGQDNRATDVKAELVAMERRWFRCALKEVARIQGAVAKELKTLAMVVVRPERVAMFTIAPELRPYSALKVELSTLNSCTVLIEGWNVIWFCTMIVQVHAIDHEVHGVFATAGGIQSERALTTKRRREKTVLRRRHRSGYQQSEIDEVAAVKRNFLHGPLIDNLAHRSCGGLDHRSISRDVNFLFKANFQQEIFHNSAPYLVVYGPFGRGV